MSNVGYATVSIIPSAKGFTAALNKQIGPSVGAAGKKGGTEAGGKFKGAFMAPLKGIAGPMAAVMGGTAAFGFLKDAVSEASDLAEVGTALATTFGPGLADVEKFGATGAKALGMSRLEALNAAQSFGVYGQAAGLSGKENAKFSTSLAALGTDLASFYNSSPEEAIAAIGSGLRGEAEPLRKFGILLDDATLRQKALSMGLIKTTKEALTPQQKVLAAQAVIMEQSKIAQGDFAKTSGGLANQQRILSAQFTDLKGKIGAALLPIVLKAVQGFNSLFDKLGGVGTAAGGLMSKLQPLTDSVKIFVGAIMGTGTTAEVPWMNALIDAGAQVRNLFDTVLVPSFQAVMAFIQTQVIPRFMGIANAIQGFVSVALPIVTGFVSGMLARIQPLMPTIKAIFGTIGQIITGAMDLIKAIIERVTSVVGYIWREWGTGIMNFIAVVWKAVLGIIGPALSVIQNVIKTVTSAIRGDWSGAWNGIKGIFSSVWALIKGILGGALSVIKSLISGAVSVIKAVWSNAWGVVQSKLSSAWNSIKSGVSSGIANVISVVRSLPGKALSALGNIGSTLLSAGSNLIGGFIRGIWSRAGELVSTIRSAITDRLPDFVKTALGIHSPSRVFMKLGEHTADGMALGIEKGGKRVTKAADALVHVPTAPGSSSSSYGPGSAGAGAPVTVHVEISPRDLEGIRSIEAFVDMARQKSRQRIGVTY